MEQNYNSCVNEAIYINFLNNAMVNASITAKGYITDTSRNGVPDCRNGTEESCGDPCCQWCNIAGAGFGKFPSSDTASTGIPNLIDAFVWAKVPGESDGTSNKSASNYDYHCIGDESVQPSPPYGQWFDTYFVMLAQNTPTETQLQQEYIQLFEE